MDARKATPAARPALFTQAFREGIPDRAIPYFVDNEFLGGDVNQWTEVAQDPGGVRTLARATGGDLAASAGTGTCSSRSASATNGVPCCGPATPAGG